jgi:hypothetical protein
MHDHPVHLLILCALAVLGAGILRAEELRQVARYPVEGVFRHVKGFDVDRSGNLLVIDSEAPAVVRIDAKGKRIASYSQPGKQYCQITAPTAGIVTKNGFVLFDWGSQRLLRFGPGGECESDHVLRTFQAGVLATTGDRIAGGGSLMPKIRGERCVFFSTDFDASASSATCLLNITDDKLWLLYGRQFVDASKSAAYYMTPYEPVLYTSNGIGPASAIPLNGLGIVRPTLPADELQIRMDRTRFYNFYNGQTVIEGVAATRAGVVVATRRPGKENQVHLYYFKDGSSNASATTSLAMDPVTGGYPLHIRGSGEDRVVLLIAKGKYPSLTYEAVIYQIR